MSAPHDALSPLQVARAQTGDRAALGRLLAALQAPLFAHVRGLLDGDAHAAEDVLQDVLLTVCRRLPALREPTLVRAWAYRIATRAAVHRARRDHRHPAGDDGALDAVAAPAHEPPFEPELVAAIPGALAGLPRASGAVLRMHYLDGLTYGEIAEALEIPLGTVKSRLAYGLAALRTRLGPLAR